MDVLCKAARGRGKKNFSMVIEMNLKNFFIVAVMYAEHDNVRIVRVWHIVVTYLKRVSQENKMFY
jgi:hypothetical protein